MNEVVGTDIDEEDRASTIDYIKEVVPTIRVLEMMVDDSYYTIGGLVDEGGDYS